MLYPAAVSTEFDPHWSRCNNNIDNIGVAAIKNNGILYHDSKTKAELLDHHFKSVFTMDDDADHLPTMSHPKYPNIENIAMSIEGVEKLLDNINIHTASGPDKIPNIIFDTCSKEISPTLANIFNKILILVPFQMTGEMQI